MYNYIAPCIVYSKSGHLVYCVLYVLIIRNTYQYVLRIVQPWDGSIALAAAALVVYAAASAT